MGGNGNGDRTERGEGVGSIRSEAPPARVEEALARAAAHGRAAAAEALAAARALIDATSLATSGEPLREGSVLGLVARSLDEVAAALTRREGAESPLLASVADALDAEIGRWEARAREDPDARAVLRAYLGVREILWELGLRRPSATTRRGGGAAAAGRRPTVQRVPVED